MKHRLFLIATALCAAVACLSITGCGEDSASPNHANTVKTSGRDTSSAPVQSAARTNATAASNVDGERMMADVPSWVTFWNPEQDGQPELRLCELVEDAAKRAKADLRSLGSVRVTSAGVAYSYADIDFIVVDEYFKVVRFIAEIEKKTPRLSWRRIEIRPERAGTDPVIPGGVDAEKTPPATEGKKLFRMLGEIRVVMKKDAPDKREAAPASDASAEKAEKFRPEPRFIGITDVIGLLYDLSLAFPEEAFVSMFRLNNGSVEFQIMTSDRTSDPGTMNIPGWKIGRLSMRITSTTMINYTVTLVRFVSVDEPVQQQKDSVTRKIKIANILALNIFNPDRVPDAPVRRDKPATAVDAREMVLVGTSFDGAVPAAVILLREPVVSMDQLDQQLKQDIRTRDELDSAILTLEQTLGVTAEQTELVRRRRENLEHRIELLLKQQKELARKPSSEGKAPANPGAAPDRRFVYLGEMLPNGYMLISLTPTSATLRSAYYYYAVTIGENQAIPAELSRRSDIVTLQLQQMGPAKPDAKPDAPE